MAPGFPAGHNWMAASVLLGGYDGSENPALIPGSLVNLGKTISILDADSEPGVRGHGAPTAEGVHSFLTLGRKLKRMPVSLRDYVEHPLNAAERYCLVRQVGHRVREADRRLMALQRVGQAPRSGVSRWTP